MVLEPRGVLAVSASHPRDDQPEQPSKFPPFSVLSVPSVVPALEFLRDFEPFVVNMSLIFRGRIMRTWTCTMR